ncbi:MAG: NUDIX domain-containing protein [Leptolyngbya sp. IPPAS B-1204]|nr:NUDIX domain-containing protein [Elainella sp. C42_A2020_010]RNJ70586.1 MAG: NUDIX domain-containing protein [Leptolyngbya sp. IPPAS B-1204]
MGYSFQYPPIDDSWYHRLPGIPEEVSAGGVVIRCQSEQVYVALIQERGAATFVLPKGRLEPGESIQQAAHREIAEEAGLTDLKLLADLGMRERLSFSKRRWKKVYYFLFSTSQVQPNAQRIELGNQLAWFPLNQLPDLYWPEQKALIDFNRERIWQAAS